VAWQFTHGGPEVDAGVAYTRGGAVYAVLMVTAAVGINGGRRRRRQKQRKRSGSEKEAMYTRIHDIYQYTIL
jgi:hypothetical protein